MKLDIFKTLSKVPILDSYKGGRAHIYQLQRSYVRKNMSGIYFTLMACM